jgi:hypothetical protein
MRARTNWPTFSCVDALVGGSATVFSGDYGPDKSSEGEEQKRLSVARNS